jgi:hypothetical protein
MWLPRRAASNKRLFFCCEQNTQPPPKMAEPPDAQDANEIEEKFKAFRATVLNETLAPELLPFKGDLVDFFKQSIKDVCGISFISSLVGLEISLVEYCQL